MLKSSGKRLVSPRGVFCVIITGVLMNPSISLSLSRSLSFIAHRTARITRISRKHRVL